jgi:enoyl-CoA hydratase
MTKVEFEIQNAVAIVTLNGESTRNALDLDAAVELADVCDSINGDDTVGAAVIRGRGSAFCSGAARQLLIDATRQPASTASVKALSRVYDAFVKVGNLAVPTIAAVNGDAVGAGLNLMLATDLRLIASGAKLISGFLRIGLHPGGGHFLLLGRTGVRDAAAAMALFGAVVDAERAVRLGLAWEAVPPDELSERCLTLAAAAAANPELARAAVHSMRTELGPPAMTWPGALEAERGRQMWSLQEWQKLAAK